MPAMEVDNNLLRALRLRGLKQARALRASIMLTNGKLKVRRARAKAKVPWPALPIHVGSDCSGLAAEILALQSIPCLARRVVHEFVSEQDASVRRALAHKYPHVKHVSGDRHTLGTAMLPNTDLYVNSSQWTTLVNVDQGKAHFQIPRGAMLVGSWGG